MNQAASWLRIVSLALALSVPAAQAQDGRGDVIYVPTPQSVVDEMLRMAKVGPDDYLIDLGSGDGRIIITAAKKLGARGFGVDLDTHLLKLANNAAKKEGVADRAHFIEQNLFETDLGPATVITSYLLPEMNERLRPKLLALKPGTRVVAHDYAMGEWGPDDEKTLIVPEKVVGDPGKSYIFLWIIPARVAGNWESQIMTGGRSLRYEFNLEQHFQLVHGTARAGEWDAKVSQFRMVGDQIAFKLEVPVTGKPVSHQFRGLVKGEIIEGNVTIGEGTGQRVVPWQARLTRRGAAYLGAAPAPVITGAWQ